MCYDKITYKFTNLRLDINILHGHVKLSAKGKR